MRFKNLLFVTLLSMLPAVVMGLSIMLIFLVEFQDRDTWLLFLGISIVIVIVLIFITNLLVPIAKNRIMAITVTIPTIIVFAYFFTILPFFTNVSPDNWLEDLGFQLWWSCIFGPFIELFLLVFMAYFGWLGTRLNVAFTRKVQKLG